MKPYTWKNVSGVLEDLNFLEQEFLRKVTAPHRHELRKKYVEGLAYEFVRQYIFEDVPYPYVAAGLLYLEYLGLYGPPSRPTDGKDRHPAFRVPEIPPRNSIGGPAWTAAIGAAAFDLGRFQFRICEGRIHLQVGARNENESYLLPLREFVLAGREPTSELVQAWRGALAQAMQMILRFTSPSDENLALEVLSAAREELLEMRACANAGS